ncbi:MULTISPECIES: hypothetical protein [Idiomarinaceae]|uniref:Lipoprotein n=1 Tax=Pseudidiomarina fusca TaxID=2965078 RepID=A0ABU3KXY5_9GAMM|nr:MULTISPECIES: hypothetical protein [Idiomarinaceae]MDT7526364.1 hypothetical protein [Pseudidiomarina sp. GXY010]MRJ43215.1 hypothetical protein [Idiomarina sp. FeN1]NCU58731.1 hypothetical protein [Idiomarina sp. FenA--70]NCU61427.1 hypothetical protein [Idiomarina sp. FenBw--71]UUN12692.1 hypothetical protein KGF88_08490 [Idiomarina loihiensis]
MSLLNVKKAVVFAVVSLFVSGCMTTGPNIGKAPGATPPQIVADAENPSARVWDDLSAFGPVPANLETQGQEVCSTLGAGYYAAGYHPRAKDFNGTTIEGGGFLCLKK